VGTDEPVAGSDARSDLLRSPSADQEPVLDLGTTADVDSVGVGTLGVVEELGAVGVGDGAVVEAGPGVVAGAVEVARVEVAADVLGATSSLWLGVAEGVTSDGVTWAGTSFT
jgi:hypothetical protein